MGAFIIRRALGAVIVLAIVSFITFCIFIVIPGGDPATRMAGKNATDANIAIIWLFFGILVGVISAVTAGRWSDRAITILALVGISMPVFWLGILARYYLGPEKAGIFPNGQYVPITQNPVDWAYHMILP